MFNFNRKEKGQGLVEYALILVLIAIVVIVAMTTLGNKVSDTFGTVNAELSNTPACRAANEAVTTWQDMYDFCVANSPGACSSQQTMLNDALAQQASACS